METFDVLQTASLLYLVIFSSVLNKKINDLGKKIEELHDKSYFG